VNLTDEDNAVPAGQISVHATGRPPIRRDPQQANCRVPLRGEADQREISVVGTVLSEEGFLGGDQAPETFAHQGESVRITAAT
jgi:hypothetical protein